MSSLLAEMLIKDDDPPANAPSGRPPADVDPAAETGRYSEADVLSAARLVSVSDESLGPPRVSSPAPPMVLLASTDVAAPGHRIGRAFPWALVGALIAVLIAAGAVVVLVALAS